MVLTTYKHKYYGPKRPRDIWITGVSVWGKDKTGGGYKTKNGGGR